jgi:hypothetical protein
MSKNSNINGFPKIGNRLDAERCKFVKRTTFDDRTIFNENSKYYTSGTNTTTTELEAWGPFTQNSVKPDKLSESLVEFCSQHDPLQNVPFYASSKFKNTCGKVFELKTTQTTQSGILFDANIQEKFKKRYIEK